MINIMNICTYPFALLIVATTLGACSSSARTVGIFPPLTPTAAITASQCASVCHVPGNTKGPDPLATGGSGTAGKHRAHVSNLGFACETCHTGYGNLVTHANGTLDTPNPAMAVVFFKSASNPTGTWVNDTGASTGACGSLACHGNDTLDWYGTSTTAFQSCPSCHVYPLGRRRSITGANGDFGGNSAIVSHHVTTTGDPTSAQCLACHNQSTHTLGTVRLRNADTGASLAYSATTPSILESFCLSCHDSNGATTAFVQGGTALNPFNDNSTLGTMPNVAGTRINAYWNGSANSHKTKGGLTCAGTGAAKTGCHGNNGRINMHGSSSKGLLTQNLSLPINSVAKYSYQDYQLCFDCHAGYPLVKKEVVLGYIKRGKYDTPIVSTPYFTAGIKSLFRERYISKASSYPLYWSGGNQHYNDTMYQEAYLPLHNFHLLSVLTSTLFSPAPNFLSWKYRGDPAQTGRISCVTCHNVHGTNGLSARGTFDEFGISPTPLSGVSGKDWFNTMLYENYDEVVMGSYPMNCSVECHGKQGPTNYWHTPSNE